MDILFFDDLFDIVQLFSDFVLVFWLEFVLEDDFCGFDLEYDNDFLVLSQVVVGKFEIQFVLVELFDWCVVLRQVEELNI